MINVAFYANVDERRLTFAVIVARTGGKLLLCRHRDRSTYEFPGGHIEAGESPLQAAKRELYEETGATRFTIEPVCAYSVTGVTRATPAGEESFGMLYRAEVFEREHTLQSEMAEAVLFDAMPQQLTYPEIQPLLLHRADSYALY